MSKTTLNQFSFNRGELDPALHGRSDWKYYSSGAEVLRNIIVRPQGGAVKRGGLRLAARALDDSRPSFLIPFRFSVRQSYMLELGDGKMRILKDGGVVVYPEGHERAGREVIVETPFPADALPRLRYAQTADVMIFTHADYAPRRLTRHDHHDWRFGRLVTGSRTLTPEGLSIAASGGDGAAYVVTVFSDDDGESPPTEAVTARHPDAIDLPDSTRQFSELYTWLRAHDYAYMPGAYAFHSFSQDALLAFLRGCGYRDHYPGVNRDGSGWHWKHATPDGALYRTLDWRDGDLHPLVRECLFACDAGWAGNAVPLLIDRIETYVSDYNASLPRGGATELTWRAVAGATGYRVYRRAAGAEDFRRVGETGSAAFTDAGLPDGSGGLPESDELFSGNGDYPGVCAFFEQRLILGRSDKQPTTFWGSDTGVYNSFTRHTPIEDTDSYEFTLSSGEMNEIHWVVPLNDMLLGTSGGEWKAGGGGSAITPSNINARVQSWYGCSSLSPVVVGRSVIFAGRSRRTIRNFSYSLEADGYAGRDLTAYASHLFADRTIVGMCHQQEPSGIVWVVLSDGALLSCTYAPEEDVAAWSRHETRGRFESCGSLVDVDGSDQIYFCVAREIGGVTRRFIESLEDAADAVRDETDGFFVDCGLTYRGDPADRVSGLDHLEGEQVACLADGSVFTGLTVRDGAVALPGGFAASVIHAGLPYSSELRTLEVEPEDGDTLRNRSRFAVAATLRLFKTRECLYSHGGDWSEVKFRVDESSGRPTRLFTGDKTVTFASPAGARSVRVRLLSETPTPFAVLGIVMEASHGQPA